MLKRIAILSISFASAFSNAATQDNIEIREGWAFPKFSTPQSSGTNGRSSASSANVFCKPYETKTFYNQADISLRTKKLERKTSTFTAPHHWAIESVTRKIRRSKRFYTGSHEQTQPNQETLSSDEYNDIYNKVLNYLLTFDLPQEIKGEIDSQLHDFVQSYSYLAYSLSSTHGAVIHRGSAGRKGIFRSWSEYFAHLDVQVVCNPPEVTSKSAAESTLRRWVEQEASKHQNSSTNKAILASATAVSTYPGYSVNNIIDGDNSTALGGSYSWANNSGSSPSNQVISLDWSTPVTFSTIKLYTSKGYEISDYQIQYYSSGRWINFANVTGNTSSSRTHTSSSAVSTSQLRVLPKKGPIKQDFYVRINEIEVF